MNCIPKICIPNIVKNNYKWVLLGLLVVVLIAIIFFVCWIGSKLSNSDSEKTPSTIIITTPSLSRIDAGNNYIVTTNFAREVIEHALAHQLKDKSEAAYQRGDLLAKRAKLMSEWTEYCATNNGR